MRAYALLLLVACGQPSSDEPGSIAADGSTIAPDSAPCSTKISYANNWISPANHAAFDLVDGAVTWDGTCID
ncbi:MAG TPA: hypothetical protein VIV40_06995, partial [Kofleriaceae bacterium]